jgi:hypothetical protein
MERREIDTLEGFLEGPQGADFIHGAPRSPTRKRETDSLGHGPAAVNALRQRPASPACAP